ncbi:EAL domain-containing protein [Metabacillus bambusae]|uniref:EAL domain-containing protein n=1 Tax=Metabacillus bambusae TaxID=2795218 RepID=A0ABS3N7W5_9BACI|nr:EAL domain-containing protein [Metabacillus bambusae]MBO1513998.1 EAL domain-containing protein [Metabacillus bambusae]
MLPNRNKLNYPNSSFEDYKSFFEYNPDATYAMLPDGNFILFNEAACELTGYTSEEVIGESYSKVIDPDFLDMTRCQFNEALSGKNTRFQSVLRTKNGERKTVSILIVPIFIDHEIKGIIGVTKDITEQIMLETLRHGQNKILQMITKNKPYQTVLDGITLLFEKISNQNGKCAIMLVDESGTKLVCGSAPSLPEKYAEILNNLSIGENTGPCGTAAFSKQTVIVEDTQSNILWDKFKDTALQFNLLACWSVPLLDDNDNVLGTFAIYYDECRSPDERDLQLLQEASYLSGIAIQHYKTKERINHLAFHDPLTGLPNRRLFDEKVELVLERSKQTMTKSSVLFIDLDRFKNINDTYGHDIGDLLLIEVSKRLKNCLRNNDVIARQGGDEFTILLEHSPIETAKEVGDRIIHTLEHSFKIQGIETFVSPSVGISVYPDHGKSSTELLKKADAAMYHAKKDGGNNYKFHDEALEKQNNARLYIENHLHKALEKNEFSLHYQPKIELSTQKIIGVEALIRWENPTLGMVPPDKFIPIAEETGLIIPIGEWVIKKACEQLKLWKAEGILSELTIAVNISIRQFFNPNLVSLIEETINETGIDPFLLDIEITESMTMNVEMATEILKDLKKLGVKISIDDFGTGYSSFNYLKHFPIDYIKIDKSFIKDITIDDQSKNIVNVFFQLAKAIGFRIVAEGVETKEQLDMLKTLNCNEVQGYLFSKPLPEDEFNLFFERFYKP